MRSFWALLSVCLMFLGLCACSKPCDIHTYTAWKTTKQATCLEIGSKTRTCTKCSETETIEIETKDHLYDNGKITKKPSCYKEGLKVITCKICGDTKEVEIDEIGHIYGELIVESTATCTSDGVSYKQCKNCSTTERYETSAVGHAFGEWIKTPSTCTENGSAYRECSACGATEQSTSYFPATGHWFDGFVCLRCGAQDPQTPPADSPLSDEYWDDFNEDLEGIFGQDEFPQGGTPPTTQTPQTNHPTTTTANTQCAHTWENATCIASKTCKTCGKTEGSVGKHNWEEATCTAPKTCKVCKKTEGDVLEHEYYEGICKMCHEEDPRVADYNTYKADIDAQIADIMAEGPSYWDSYYDQRVTDLEAEITTLHQRLAYLRQDTSGANQGVCLNLESEIENKENTLLELYLQRGRAERIEQLKQDLQAYFYSLYE